MHSTRDLLPRVAWRFVGLLPAIVTGVVAGVWLQSRLEKHGATNFADTSSAIARPNILFAISDDQSWKHAGAYGDRSVRTPAFDRIAREGVLFQHAFCAAPSCTPSRSAILTGQAIWRLGEGGVLFGALPADLDVFPQLLRENGYFVGYTGKSWGPGDIREGGWSRNPVGKKHETVWLNPQPPDMSTVDYAGNFEQFLERRPKDRPFCFWYGSFEPHLAHHPGQGVAAGKKLSDARSFEFLPDDPIVRGDILDYYVEVEHFDRHLSRMLGALERSGELDRTLVIATSDQGCPFPRAKATLYDSGTRVPLAIRFPAEIPGGRTILDLVSLTDLAPTILEFAGVEPPEAMTGLSLKSILTSNQSGRIDPARDFVVTALERHVWSRPGGLGYPMRAMRTFRYLYIRNYEPDRWPAGDGDYVSSHGIVYGDYDACPTKTFMMRKRDDPEVAAFFQLAFGKRPREELYDVERDPDQLLNLASDPAHGETLQSLRNDLNDYLVATGDPRTLTRSPWDSYPYYFGWDSYPDYYGR